MSMRIKELMKLHEALLYGALIGKFPPEDREGAHEMIHEVLMVAWDELTKEQLPRLWDCSEEEALHILDHGVF